MNITPITPSFAYETQFLEYAREYQRGAEPFYAQLYAQAVEDFDEYLDEQLELAEGAICGDDVIPQITWWFIDSRNKVIGVGRLRLGMNEYLARRVGHLGYDIRPSERRRGYGTQICTFLLNEAKKRKLGDVLIMCEGDNEPSKKIITKSGGELTDSCLSPATDNVMLRYWIRG